MIESNSQSVIEPEPPKKTPVPEPATTTGEGNLESEQVEVMRAAENDATVDDEANLIA